MTRRQVRSLFVISTTLVFLGADLPRTSTAQSSIPRIVLRASSAYKSEMSGVVGLQRHFDTIIRGGPMHHTEHSDSGLILSSGAFVAARYYSIVDDGRPLSEDTVGKRTAQTNQDWSAGKVFFKEPYDPRFISDYGFQLLGACDDCPPGSVAVHFASSIRDIQHGAGTMWIDARTARVLSLTYAPNELPPHATAGTVTEVSGSALASLWYVVRINESYQGKAAIFHGTGTFAGTFDHFRRYRDRTAAMEALQRGSI